MMDFEQYKEIGRKVREEEQNRKELEKQWHNDYLRSIGVDPDKQQHIQPQIDSIYSLENGGATILWLIVAIGAFIFKGGWIISIIATVIWFNHITRHWEV